MTDEQILNTLRSCGDGIAICDDCVYYGKAHCSILAKQDIIARFEELLAENAELKVQLEKAVELPCKLGKNFAVKDYGFGRYRIEEVNIVGYNFNPYSPEIFPVDSHEDSYFSKEVFPTREAAEARLKELQGGEQ